MADKQFSLFDLLGLSAMVLVIALLWADNSRLKQQLADLKSENEALIAQLKLQKAESEGLMKGILLRR